MDSITRNEARRLIRQAGLSDTLIRHSEGVARRAEAVCRLLEAVGHTLYTEKVVLASLLHDIGLSRPHGLDHGAASAEVLEEFGLTELAKIIRVHVFTQTTEESMEAKILIYANLTTGPEGESIDPEKKLKFLHHLAYNWKDENERQLALRALGVKRKILSEVQALITKAITVS